MKALRLLLILGVGGLVASAADTKSTSQVTVTITSDGETWVSVTNVLPPAQFKAKQVALAPGEYEVIGRRKGYWDVRQVVSVRENPNRGVVSVVCTLTTDYWPDGSLKK